MRFSPEWLFEALHLGTICASKEPVLVVYLNDSSQEGTSFSLVGGNPEKLQAPQERGGPDQSQRKASEPIRAEEFGFQSGLSQLVLL